MTPVVTGLGDSADLTPQTVAVVGLGLIGGSLVRGLARLPVPRVCWERARTPAIAKVPSARLA